MSNYVLLYKDWAAVLDVPPETSADGWRRIQDGFAKACGRKPGTGCHWVSCYRLWPDQFRDGIFWDEELAGPDGISVRLIVFPGVDKRTVKLLRNKIRRERDVVRMSTTTPKRWLPAGTIPGQVDPSGAHIAKREWESTYRGPVNKQQRDLLDGE